MVNVECGCALSIWFVVALPAPAVVSPGDCHRGLLPGVLILVLIIHLLDNKFLEGGSGDMNHYCLASSVWLRARGRVCNQRLAVG